MPKRRPADTNGLGVLDAFRCEVLEELTASSRWRWSCRFPRGTDHGLDHRRRHASRPAPFRVYRVEKYIDQTVASMQTTCHTICWV